MMNNKDLTVKRNNSRNRLDGRAIMTKTRANVCEVSSDSSTEWEGLGIRIVKCDEVAGPEEIP